MIKIYRTKYIDNKDKIILLYATGCEIILIVLFQRCAYVILEALADLIPIMNPI